MTHSCEEIYILFREKYVINIITGMRQIGKTQNLKMQEKNYKIPRVKRLARKRIRHIDLEAVDKLIVASIWHENRLGYLSLDIICSKKRTVFRSRKTVSFEEQMMSKDKYLTQHIFLPNRAYCVYYPSNSFCNMCGFEN